MVDNPSPHGRRTRSSMPMHIMRYWLPGAIAVFGVVLIVLGHGAYSYSTSSHSLESATGVALLIVAVIVWMINWMYRLSISSNLERDEEEEAREHFDRTGRWPEDEEPRPQNGAR